MFGCTVNRDSWVIYSSSVAVESEGSFLTEKTVPLAKMWGKFFESPKSEMATVKLEMIFLMVWPTVLHHTWFLRASGSRNSYCSFYYPFFWILTKKTFHLNLLNRHSDSPHHQRYSDLSSHEVWAAGVRDAGCDALANTFCSLVPSRDQWEKDALAVCNGATSKVVCPFHKKIQRVIIRMEMDCTHSFCAIWKLWPARS